jgi:hypothetical protein
VDPREQPTAVSATAPSQPDAGDDEPTPVAPIDFESASTSTEHFACLVGALRQRDPFLASEIEQTVFLQRFDAQALVMAVSQTDHEGVARTLPKLESALTLLCPSKPSIELAACPFDDERLSGETLYVRRRRLEKEERARRQEAARTDPTIIMAAETLGATIVDIKPR